MNATRLREWCGNSATAPNSACFYGQGGFSSPKSITPLGAVASRVTGKPLAQDTSVQSEAEPSKGAVA